jgi:hypothetical protein
MQMTDALIGQRSHTLYVDNFEHAYYDIDYRPDVKGHLSKWIVLDYADGTVIEVSIDDIGDECMSSPRSVEESKSRGHVGDGNRIFPAKVNHDTTPRLWQVKWQVLKIMDDYNTLFMLTAFPAVWMILTMPIGMAGPGSKAKGGRIAIARGNVPKLGEASPGGSWAKAEVEEMVNQGHTLEKHGPQQMRPELAQRILKDPTLQSSSRWLRREDIAETVKKILADNEKKISDWLAKVKGNAPNTPPPKLERIPVGRSVGEGYIRVTGEHPMKGIKRPGSGGLPQEIGVEWHDKLTAVTVVLRSGGPHGFYVLTAIPTIP